jgi:hypothetical protein
VCQAEYHSVYRLENMYVSIMQGDCLIEAMIGRMRLAAVIIVVQKGSTFSRGVWSLDKWGLGPEG